MNPLRIFISIAAALILGAAAHAAQVIEVYKNEACGCCELWVKHLQKNGFTVKAQNVQDTGAYRAKFGVPEKVAACHTAVIQGYAIEGHVPARDIKRLLAERPKAKGLAVPGMPVGSPGMESDRPEPYDVLLVKPDGTTTVFQSYR